MLENGTFLVDRYEILSQIGAGGMSDVYKAMDHILGRYVAIKVLKSEFSEDRTFVSKFRTEAQSAAGLEHPNIVNIYDVGSDEGLYYIVMEYVDGVTLKTYIEKKGQLTFKESVSIAISVARGIDAAHGKDIIHRDIKPQNIMISTEGKVKVTDFGIARAVSSNTISADVMGSVHYVSPEQARNGFVDCRSDIYSLGIVMYEMVTGRVPFDGDTTVAVAIQHLQEEMVEPAVYAKDIPACYNQIIMKCTMKNPDRRYQTIAELLADLRKALSNPNEDFVVMIPAADAGKTKVITEDDLKEINELGKDEDLVENLDENAVDEDGEDEDEEGVLNPKMDKAVTIMAIVTAAIIVIVIIYLIGSLAGIWKIGSKKPSETQKNTIQTESQSEETETEEMVEMINIVGMDLDEAIEKLEKLGLEVFITKYDSTSSEKVGTITKQYTKKGEKIAKGKTVNVAVSGSEESVQKNTKSVTIANVVGKTESEAESMLGDSVTITKSYEYSDTVASSVVISQTPEGGSSVAKDKNGKVSVKLVISQGKKSVTVPSVIGNSEDTAKSTLSGLGLVVSVSYAEDNDNVGKVIEQSLSQGKSVQSGTAITITVGVAAKTYSINQTYNAPSGATKYEYTLTVNGSVVSSESASGTSFTVSASGLSAASGSLSYTWYDDTDTMISSKTDPVNFTAE